MMRTALFVAGGIAALAMFGCAHSINLRPDGTPGRAPSGYVTFFILEGNSSDTPVRDQQVKAEIVAALADRGLVETSPDEAEAVVVVHTATSAKHSRDSFYDGWGGWSWQVGGTTAARGTEDYKLGTLVVDMFDAWTKKLVWHAAVSDAGPANLKAGAHAVSKAVTRLFRDFPAARATERGKALLSAGRHTGQTLRYGSSSLQDPRSWFASTASRGTKASATPDYSESPTPMR
jgi:hypothetical protein